MNVHHLELFYYVARHGGIMPAVRNIPYGIQQPAVSSQMAQLEEYLGKTLFRRRPFALTAEGERLFEFIQPFFSNLDKIADELQSRRAQHIRIGASSIVLRDYLPELLQKVRKKFTSLRVSLRQGYQADLEKLLEREEIDLAITVIEKKPPAGIHSLKLIELPLVLLVKPESKITSANQLWKLDKVEEPLICLPAAETISKNFQKGLSKIGVDWFPGIEASSLELIETYVANGFGIGVSVALPQIGVSEKIRMVTLADFSPVVVGALWRGKTNQLLQTFLDELNLRGKQFARG